jgi:hypothetical protein
LAEIALPNTFAFVFYLCSHGTQNIHSVFGLHGNRISVLQLYYESGLCRCHFKGSTFGSSIYGCIHHPIIPRSEKGRREKQQKKEIAILLSEVLAGEFVSDVAIGNLSMFKYNWYMNCF